MALVLNSGQMMRRKRSELWKGVTGASRRRRDNNEDAKMRPTKQRTLDDGQEDGSTSQSPAEKVIPDTRIRSMADRLFCLLMDRQRDSETHSLSGWRDRLDEPSSQSSCRDESQAPTDIGILVIPIFMVIAVSQHAPKYTRHLPKTKNECKAFCIRRKVCNKISNLAVSINN